MNPATRAALYTIKPTLGLVPGSRIIPISKRYDTAGPMAKSVKDVANLLTVLVDPKNTDVPLGGYAAIPCGDWGDIRVGTLDPEKWTLGSEIIKPVAEATEQIVSCHYHSSLHTKL